MATTTRGVKPHHYFPDYMAMGDCVTCGHVQESPIHIKEMAAEFSGDMVYRYTLTREWFPHDDDPLSCLFVCLNPSTADENKDDPTVRRCIGFARKLGYSKLTVCNIFALRSTDPKVLYEHADPVGPKNDEHIAEEAARHELVIAAWGNHGRHRHRSSHVMALLREHAPDGYVHVLGLNSTTEPKHPLYLSADLQPIQLWP